MRSIKVLLMLAFGLFFSFSAFAQGEQIQWTTDEEGRRIVDSEDKFWAIEGNNSYVQDGDITITSNETYNASILNNITYDGNGHKIKFAENVQRKCALFKQVSGTSVFNNVVIDSVIVRDDLTNFTYNEVDFSPFIAIVSDTVTLNNCKVSMDMLYTRTTETYYYIGGLIGTTKGENVVLTMNDCEVSGTININISFSSKRAKIYLGGFLGFLPRYDAKPSTINLARCIVDCDLFVTTTDKDYALYIGEYFSTAAGNRSYTANFADGADASSAAGMNFVIDGSDGNRVYIVMNISSTPNNMTARQQEASFTIENDKMTVPGINTSGNVTIKKNLIAGRWNFIGFANSENINPLAAEDMPDVWALPFDYSQNNWSTEFLHAGDALARGNGIFVWLDTNDTVISTSNGYMEDEITVSHDITGSVTAAEGRWMALANPYTGLLEVAKFVNDNNTNIANIQGQGVYTYGGNSFTFKQSGNVSVGEGFFVNMADGANQITFTPNQIYNYTEVNNPKTVKREKEYVQVSVSTDGYKVPVMICQNDLASEEYDIFDANKMFGDGSVAEPYFVTEGINLCKEEIATMPYYATMNIKSGEARTVEIVADAIPEGYSATLIDGDEEIELTEGMVYTTDIASGENAERFKLLIGEKNVSLEDAEAVENLIRVSNTGRRVNISAQGAIEAEVYNALGQKVYSTTDNNFTLDGVSAGAYVIKVSNGKSVKSEKIIVQ